MLDITSTLNELTNKIIRWCTPSIDPEILKVLDPYTSDISVSFQSLGYPQEPSGIFLDAYKKASLAYGSDHSLFVVNGTTGSNYIVLRTLNKQIPNLRILAQRNIHKSVLSACEDYNINLMLLPPNVDKELQIFLPNSISEILKHVKKQKPHVLLITNPTYEGITLDIITLVKVLRAYNPKLIIYIEEAWGSHLHFSDKLPDSAMSAGADICVQSTHKQGGGLQQTSMIHWKNGRINNDILKESYRSLLTTSPSYLLLASIDASRSLLEKKGKIKIDKLLEIAVELTNGLKKIHGFEVITTHNIKERNNAVFKRDETKVILDVSQSGYTGYELAEQLEKNYRIIVEKCNVETILFLIPFQATMSNVSKTITALQNITKKNKANTHTQRVSLSIPKKFYKVLEVSEVSKLLTNQIETVSLQDARGRIAAEDIIPYPPGIPITIRGEELTDEVIDYYIKLKAQPNCHILAQSKTLDTVVVVK